MSSDMKQDLVAALGVNHLIISILTKGRKAFTDIRDLSFDEATNPTGELRKAIFIDDLRAALEKLPVMTGYQQTNGIIYCGDGKDSSVDTHTARLFAIEEIKREPLKHEFSFLVGSGICAIPEYFKGKTVKVTVEEIVGNGDPL